MDPLDFLSLAEELAERTEEAAWRTAVSRAYYSVFLHLAHSLKALEIDVGRGSAPHRLVPRFLRHSRATAPIAYELDTLRRRRRTADYDMDVQVFQQSARAACRRARRIRDAFAGVNQERLLREL